MRTDRDSTAGIELRPPGGPLRRPLPARSSRRGENSRCYEGHRTGARGRPPSPGLSPPNCPELQGGEENFDRTPDGSPSRFCRSASPFPHAVCGGRAGDGGRPRTQPALRRRAPSSAPPQPRQGFLGEVGRWCRPGGGAAGAVPIPSRRTAAPYLRTPHPRTAGCRPPARLLTSRLHATPDGARPCLPRWSAPTSPSRCGCGARSATCTTWATPC